MKKIFTLLLLVNLYTLQVFSQCSAPTSISKSNVTSNSALINWVCDPSITTWKVRMSVNFVVTEVITTSKPFLFQYDCDDTFSVSVKNICANGVESSYTSGISFTTPDCAFQYGTPLNISQCAGQNNLACIDLSSNTQLILGNLTPSEHTVGYYTSQNDAITEVNPLGTNPCFASGDYVVYSKVKENLTQIYQIKTFTIKVRNYSILNSLNPLTQCDENNDGVVIYDLTSVQSQIQNTNPLIYYSALANDINQSTQILNPSAYSVNSNVANSTIYVREVTSDICQNIFPMTLFTELNCNMASNCINANSLCGSLGASFVNTINVPNNGSAGCLGTTPNGTWFNLQISNSGSINLQINQGNNAPLYNNLDIDYIIYGPFTTSAGNCTSVNSTNVVSCSYSAQATEYPIIPNAIAGQYYLMMVTNFSNQPGIININVLPTSTGTIDCTGMAFTAFLDSNNNGTKDSGEVNFPLGEFHYEKNNDGTVHNITAPTGKFTIYENNISSSYDVSFSVNPLYASLYSVNPSEINNLSVTNGVLSQYYFPVTSLQNYNDLGVVVVPVNNPRPGFNYYNKIVYGNLGNQVVTNGTVTFTKDAAVSIVSVSQAGIVNNANGFSYDFTNLQPFEYRTIDVTMLVPTIPTVNAGQFLVSSATIAPLTGDISPENNANSISQMIINAYDPNDKTEAHGPEILHSSFTSNDYLYYTIRFENTGNASAINVRVNDVLNSMLDENTIKVESASHAYVLDRVGNNLTWKFDNIMLPVSVANTMTGKGYITFKIKPKPGYAVGDIIPNTASIYFDFNPAIVTNTFQTEFVAVLKSETFLTDEFAVYPNPTTSILNVQSKLNMTISEVNVYDILGKQLLNKKINVSSTEIDMTNYSPGLYLLEVVSENNQKSIHKIIKK